MCGWDIIMEVTPGMAQHKSLTSILCAWSSAWSSSMEMVSISVNIIYDVFFSYCDFPA